ncbi:DUF1826 domain-containing protein [Nisaea sp.]|uniref:DUF1826 domain-containing protein n=1 Tax=Nisaea sp. TaxID=2024842 RepID=UPI0032654B7A
MTIVRELVRQETAIGVGVVDRPEGLSIIQRPDCAAAVWQRLPLAGFQSWIDMLPPSNLPKARVILRVEDVHDAVTQICEACGTPDCPERQMLVDDTAALANLFAGLMDTAYLRLRFDVVTTNSCRKFHIDAVTARLICTYRGTGTHYGNAAGDAAPRRVFTAGTGAPILLRGRLWPESPDAGLQHRSPPIAGTGETRLVLVLDPVADPEAHPDRRLMH